MAQRKASRRARNGDVTAVRIDGGANSAGVKAIRADIVRQLELATVMGRTEIAVELVRALRDMGGVHNATIQNCTFDVGR